ncbi:DMT family transporter [Acidimangrovimonas pyrenivorans]|uniref:DMT family transporter n=1 Tax=Acidimangrovimonas pyrenivorans TaxID=2030798 RepID=A0ABV7AGY0_9RHOB
MSEARGLAAAALTGVQVGATITATRALSADLGPVTLALMRYGIGLLVLAPFFLRLRRVPIAPRDILPLLALGTAQFGLLVWLLNWGLARVPAGRGALIFAMFPLLTLVLAATLGREAMSWRKVAGVLVSILGVALTLGESLLRAAGGSAWGALAVLAAAGTGAGCAVFYRPYLERYPTLQVGFVAMAAAVAALALGSLSESPGTAVAGLDRTGWALVLFIGLASGAGYLLWLTALRHTTPTRATVLMGLSPATAAVLGIALLGERATPTLWLGLAAVLAGAALTARGGKNAPETGLAFGETGR